MTHFEPITSFKFFTILYLIKICVCVIDSGNFTHVPLQRAVNLSADPCKDFYAFSCGNYESYVRDVLKLNSPQMSSSSLLLVNQTRSFSKELLLNGKPRESLPSMVNGAMLFHRTCLKNTDGLQDHSRSLITYLDKIGGWPILGKWKSGSFSWMEASAYIYRTLNFQTFIRLTSNMNQLNFTENIIVLQQGRPRSYISRRVIRKMCEFFNSTLSPYEIAEDINDLIKFRKNIMSILTRMTVHTHDMTISTLQRTVPHVKWLRYFQLILNDTFQEQNRTLTTNDSLVVDGIRHFKEFFRALKQVPNRTIANYFGWVVAGNIKALLSYMNLQGLSKENSTEVKHIKTYHEKFCNQYLNNFSPAMSYLYVKAVKSDNGIQDLLLYLNQSFHKLVESSKWVDSKSKSRILTKFRNIRYILGHNDFYNTKEKFEERFGRFPAMSDDDVQNFILAQTFFTRSKFRDTFSFSGLDRLDDYFDVSNIGASYKPSQNVIVLPVGEQNVPHYYHSGQKYLNFGSMGFTLGHEIHHGYVNRFATINEHKEYGTLFEKDSMNTMESKKMCFREQFKKYYGMEHEESSTSRYFSEFTLEENMADTAGLKQAYKAYELWKTKNPGEERRMEGMEKYTPEQMLFIAYAQIWCTGSTKYRRLDVKDRHSPPYFRTVGAVSNLDEFGQAFKCQKGTPMNPENKCTFW